ETAVLQKTFREDLYYRLGAAEIRIPPLRQRVEDIRPLVEYFLNRFSVRLGALPPSMTPAALQLLEKQPWPGNIRELQNVIQKCIIECRGLPITEDIILASLYTPAAVGSNGADPLKIWVDGRIKDSMQKNESGLALRFQQEVENLLIQRVGEHTRWNKSSMAKLLGWSRPTLYQKLAAYHLSDDERVKK
ncbi:MAG: helix-turn-helix domain-containing protein, partial [Candidatus Methylacidiphilales bacterium]